MAEKENAKEELTEVQKLQQEDQEKAKKYKTPIDIERLAHLLSDSHILLDHPRLSAIVGSVTRELTAINLTQDDLDKKEREEHEKKLADAKSKDAKAAKDKAEKEEKEAEASEAHTKKRSAA